MSIGLNSNIFDPIPDFLMSELATTVSSRDLHVRLFRGWANVMVFHFVCANFMDNRPTAYP